MPPTGAPLHPSYQAAGVQTQETYAWRPPITSADSSTLWERNLTNQRMLDLVRNDPHARSVRMKLVDMLRARVKWHLAHPGVVPTVRGLRVARTTATYVAAERTEH